MRPVASVKKRERSLLPAPLLFVGLAAGFLLAAAAGPPEDWASSSEAYFLTGEERAEWKTLDSRDSRQRFRERYWLKRDPSPGTEKNEFRELVLARIKTADGRFRIHDTPGSRTARGMVFIVLGSPARAVDQAAPQPPRETGAGRRPGQGVTPVALNEGNETTSTWFYETDRTPRILEVLGRPSLEVRIVLEPSRHKDAIQDPGLFHEAMEIVARKSVVNPDLVPAGSTGEVFAADPPAAPRQALPGNVRAILEAAPSASRGKDFFASSASIFHETSPAEAVIWIFAPPPARGALFHGLVRAPDGREVAAWSETAVASSIFSAGGSGAVFAHRLSLAAGTYAASVALTDPGGAVLASSTLPVRVPIPQSGFAVSSLILTRGPAPADPKGDRTFAFGGTLLPPRADALFSASQSLWYFVEVANAADAAKVMLEPRLRRGGDPVGSLAAFPAKLQPIGGGRYIAGVELPLATLGPGDYVLYLAVLDGDSQAAARELRRADFRVIP